MGKVLPLTTYHYFLAGGRTAFWEQEDKLPFPLSCCCMEVEFCKSLTDLPVDVLCSRIIPLISPRDVIGLAITCRRARKTLLHDDVWQQICQRSYPQTCSSLTTLWLGKTTRYRLLYPVLAAHAEYVGVWHSSASSKGALYSFRWGDTGIDLSELVACRRFLTSITHHKLCTLGPVFPRFQAEVVDGSKCILRDLGSSFASATTCAVAAAAACVAAGGASSSRNGAGDGAVDSSSPGSSSFCAELLRFMQSSVQKTRSSRRSRRSGGGSETSQPVLHHFDRVVFRHTARHPLEGLWKGLYGPHGCEMLAIRYDLSGSSARIIATKLTGDANVPAGQVTWQATAAAVPEPWPEAEQQLLAQRPGLVERSAHIAAHLAEMEAADEAAGNLIAALIQQEEPPQQAMQFLQQQHADNLEQPDDQGLQEPGQQQAEQQQAGIAGVADLHMQQQQDAAHIAAWAAKLQARRVVRVMKGQGQIARPGFKEPQWVEGRLWVYEDPVSKSVSCGFLFMHGHQIATLIDLERLDGDL